MALDADCVAAGASSGRDRLVLPKMECTCSLAGASETEDINAQVAESINGMAALQACNAEAAFGERFAKTNQEHYTARLDELRANAWLLRPALDLLNSCLLVLVIYVFGQRQFSGLEVGVLYAFVSYIARVVDPLIQITLQFGQIQQAVVSAARVNHLLHEKAIAAVESEARIEHGAMHIQDLYFAYERGKPVLQASI